MSYAASTRIHHLIRMHRTAQAVEEARRLLVERPDDHDALLLLIAALTANRDLKEANKLAIRACGVHPESAAMHDARARAHYATGVAVTAAYAAAKAVELAPFDAHYLMFHAECLVESMKFSLYGTRRRRRFRAQMITSADHALQLTPHAAEAHFVRALVHLVHRQPELAEERAAAGLAIDPNSAYGHEVMGRVRLRRRRFRDAGDHFVDAGRADPAERRPATQLTLATLLHAQLAIVILAGMMLLACWQEGLLVWGVVISVVLLAVAAWLRWAPSRQLSDDAKRAEKRARKLS